MSGTGYDAVCPNCGDTLDCYSDYKPHDYVSGQCLSCGFYYWTKTGQLTLKELNQARKERNEDMNLEGKDRLKPLKTLPPLKSYL